MEFQTPGLLDQLLGHLQLSMPEGKYRGYLGVEKQAYDINSPLHFFCKDELCKPKLLEEQIKHVKTFE